VADGVLDAAAWSGLCQEDCGILQWFLDPRAEPGKAHESNEGKTHHDSANPLGAYGFLSYASWCLCLLNNFGDVTFLSPRQIYSQWGEEVPWNPRTEANRAHSSADFLS